MIKLFIMLMSLSLPTTALAAGRHRIEHSHRPASDFAGRSGIVVCFHRPTIGGRTASGFWFCAANAVLRWREPQAHHPRRSPLAEAQWI